MQFVNILLPVLTCRCRLIGGLLIPLGYWLRLIG